MTAFPIPPTARAFVKAPPLTRLIEVEVIGFRYDHDGNWTIVRSIDKLQPMPFYRPNTLYPTDLAIVPTASVIITMAEGTGPTIELDEEPEYRPHVINDDADCIRYAGAPH